MAAPKYLVGAAALFVDGCRCSASPQFPKSGFNHGANLKLESKISTIASVLAVGGALKDNFKGYLSILKMLEVPFLLSNGYCCLI
jgi:hypothetical protein